MHSTSVFLSNRAPLITRAVLVLLALTLSIAATRARAADQVRPFWGSEALWGYWAYGEDYLVKRDWKIVSPPQEGVRNAVAAIDGDSETFVASAGVEAIDLVIDLGKPQEIGALTILTLARPNKAIDSRMAKYEIHVSDAKDNPGPAIAAAAFDAEEGSETIVKFAPAKGRFVTLRAFARATPTKDLVIREVSLVAPDVVKRHDAALATAAADRRAAWEARDSEAVVDALGKELLDMVFCTNDDINRSNLRTRNKLEEVGKLKQAGKFADGVRAFRDYYFDKLRHPQRFGLHANDVSPYGRGYGGISDFPQAAMDKDLKPDGIKKQVALADDLLKGLAMFGKEQVTIGEPGAVDWSAPAQPWGYTTKARQNGPYRELWWGETFRPLFTAYIATKDERYLKRWVAYMDDWATSRTFLSEIHPAINHDNSGYPVVLTIRMFAAIAEALPYESDAVSAPAFARIMRKLVTESPLNFVVYMRGNGNGWTPGAGQMLLAMMIDEFKVAPLYFRETRRRNIEDINVTQQLRDGTETHQWPGYNFLLLRNAGALRLIDARDDMPDYAQPAWERDLHTIAWRKELTEALDLRATYMLHWASPSGEYPLVTHQEPPHEKRYKFREGFEQVPSMLDDPTNARLFSTFYGDGSAGEPSYTSEWFPYGGYSIARDGWARTDGYASMFCSPQPGCGGVGSGCKNNAFALSAYGMDLLGDDLVHAYVRPTSPIQVDGKRQQLDFYIPKTPWPTGHRGDMIEEWTEPSPWRWHSSAAFDLMEGVFNGVYANDFKKRDEFVAGVAHQRLALHARAAGLWIITDRMKTADKHDYEQLWWLPLKNPKRKELPGFTADAIDIDAAAHTIKTRRTTTDKRFDWDRAQDLSVPNVNLSIYQFTDAPITYATKPSRPGSDEMYDWMRLGVTWQGQGDQQVITALFPRKPTPEKAAPDGTENDLTSIKAITGGKGVNGFEAVTPSGQRVTYLAAASGSAPLSIDGITGTGEALLIERPAAPGGAITGVVLGSRGIKIGATVFLFGEVGAKLEGPPVSLMSRDFEFSVPASLDPAKFRVTPIFRPISPVKILPESNVFADAQEVTLKSDTPGVVLTYTLDGTEPTPQSTPYTAPFLIDHTRTIKARAYRPGVEKNPPHTSGTLATPTSYAVFTKQLPSRAEQVVAKAQGLNCDYYEGFWRDLWLNLDKTKPTKSAPANDLFDLSILPDENPAVGPKLAPRQHAYALKYTGYLNVPADGVYTIHAPHEFVHPDQVAGYELQVYLGHASKPDVAGPKREAELNFWYPATRLHAFGSWSVPLKKGAHEFKVVYIDFRTDAGRYLNRVEGVPDALWTGERPNLTISGGGLERQPIPAGWLSR